MKFSLVTLITVGICGASSLPGRSQTLPPNPPNPSERSALTKEEVLTACVQERAETLPQLYTDVPPDHWAFKPVQTMAYCGAYRSATPPALIEELLNSDNNEPPYFGDRMFPGSGS